MQTAAPPLQRTVVTPHSTLSSDLTEFTLAFGQCCRRRVVETCF